LLHFGLEIRSI